MIIYSSETLRVLKWKGIKLCFFLSCLPLTLLHIILNLTHVNDLLSFMKKKIIFTLFIWMLTSKVYFPGLVQIAFYTLPVTIVRHAHSQNTIRMQELALGLRAFRVFGFLPAQIQKSKGIKTKVIIPSIPSNCYLKSSISQILKLEDQATAR